MERINIHGVNLRSPNDAVVMHYKREIGFEDAAVALWRDNLTPDTLALDIGAYTGLYSIIAAQAGCPCIGFEPNPTAVERALLNAADNGVEIELQEIALGAESGPALLSLKGNRPMTSAASVMVEHGETIQVQQTTLDDLSLDQPVAIIKIDAERAEPSILAGAQRLIDRDRPIIITECLDGKTTLLIAEQMKNHGYQWSALEPCMIAWHPPAVDAKPGTRTAKKKGKSKK